MAFLVLVGGALHPARAAAIVPNPEPALISVWEPCEPNTGVTEIVDFQALGGHDVQVRCAPGEPASGVYALEEAGFTVTGTLQYGKSFICRIDGQPTPAEEGCEHTPGSGHYWAYYHAQPGGQWEYSGLGASAYIPKIGSVEGWGFAQHLTPGGPDIRIPAQDGRGAELELPPTASSSAIQLRLAQEWLVRRLLRFDPATEGTETDAVNRVVTYVAALARSGYPLTGVRFAGIRDFLADATVAAGDTGFDASPPLPRPTVLGTYAIALAALEGGEPLLSDGTNMRRWLTEDIDPATGKVLKWEQNFGSEAHLVESGPEGGAVLEALARTGALPGRATALAEMIERTQRSDGSFVEVGQDQALSKSLAALRGLSAAKTAGSSVGGIDDSIARLTNWVLGLQGGDGSIAPSGSSDSDFATTAPGAAILALGGEEGAAVRAAEWLSPYQISAELAGGGPNSTTGGPGSPDVGAFTESLAGLREAITNGVGSQTGVVAATPAAVEALALAPWLTPEAARVSTPLALSVGTERALVAGSVATGTFDQSIAVEFGPTTGYGSTATGPNLVAEFGQTPVEVELGGLAPASTYHYRLVSTGPLGVTVYGGDGTLSTAAALPVGAEPPPDSRSGGGSSGRAPASSFATVRTRGGAVSPTKSGIARIATLSCPAGASCTLAGPARVRLSIAGRTYWATVLMPRSLAGGTSATLRVKLTKAAVAALAGHAAAVVVPVTLTGAAGKRTLQVKARLTAARADDRKRG